jgi:hypothetical protein
MLLICSDDAVKRINDPSIDSLKLLHQLSLELLAIPFPVLPLFVFDGPLRPDRKRGRQMYVALTSDVAINSDGPFRRAV